MKERPILFSGPMVRAILEGRKTQTRRVAIPRHDDRKPCEHWCGAKSGAVMMRHCEHGSEGRDCPHGIPGDRLWVKETWKPHCEGPISDAFPLGTCVKYRADGACVKPDTWDYEQGAWCEMHEESTKWRPSIFMPRWASRITLEVVGVKVERLQKITERDAIAEGLFSNPKYGHAKLWTWDGIQGNSTNPVYAYQLLWDSINGKRGFAWCENPWVWAITFNK